MGESRIMWEPTPETVQKSNMMKFINAVNANHRLNIGSYGDLYQWSVDHLSDFWGDLWDFLEIKASRKFDRVVDDATIMPGAKWFEGARLNFAENLLRFRDDRVALVFRGEAVVTRKLTYADLFERVAKLSNALREYGIKPGDRVAGFIPNMPEAIIAMLAAVSVGATWSSCSPDFGINGVFDRFGQIQPRILFIADGYYYKNKKLSSLERVAGIVEKIPSIEKVIVIPYTEAQPDIGIIPNAVAYETSLPDSAARRSNSNSSRRISPCTSCIPREPPACPNAWCKAPRAS
ncbi:AMP-binding protein [Desulfosarcina cetonica]|uniref:AMP-binding protein n=1 Tax=Desulfosarcina cetonica TaxID=90730 RepID=UPI000A56EAC0|nr:AMP-binding protein [Desulfosarcina cetonica]